jgi:Lrp/AsnC family leucine-responsive transcriptional regulator
MYVLAADPRVTFAELGRRVGLSAPAVAERVRLERDGVLRYRVEVAPEALGAPARGLGAHRARPRAGAEDRRARAGAARGRRLRPDQRRGLLLLKLHVASMEHLERLLDRFLAFGRTTSSFVVATPVPPRPLPAARA